MNKLKDYYTYTTTALQAQAKIPLNVLPDATAVFHHLATTMVDVISANNTNNAPTVMVVPVGPTGQYPDFVNMVNKKRINLANVWFLNMDEYLTSSDQWLPSTDPLSFRGFMQRAVYAKIDPALLMPPAQRLFPDPEQPTLLADTIANLGKLDLVIGGIGITGHIAFNEPEPTLSEQAFMALPTRPVTITEQTRATNAINDLHGAVELMPQRAITIGMQELRQAKKIRLGCFRDWHRGVVSRAICDQPTSAFPVTLLQQHNDIELAVPTAIAEYPLAGGDHNRHSN